MNEPMPQRFRHRPHRCSRWYFGCCYYLATWDAWLVTGWMLGGSIGQLQFDDDPWPAMDKVIGDSPHAELEWIDNEFAWQGRQPIKGPANATKATP